jgi:predicted MPP superfamily phosphohydrolase
VLTRRQFLKFGGAALASAAGLGFYSWQIEPHWPELVRRSMPLEYLPHDLEGSTLLQISDIHVGPRVSSSYLIRALTRAHDLTADFVAFTGDFVSYRSAHEYRELARVLKALPHGRLATVAALGNHDYGPNWRHVDIADLVSRVAEDAGAVVLRNEVRTMGGLQFAGLADLWSPEFGEFGEPDPRTLHSPSPDTTTARLPPHRTEADAALSMLTPGLSTVVLAHNPDAQDLPIWDGVHGWVLAGHTHGGQVKPPFLPPLILPVRNKRYSSGEFAVGPGRTLYINRGLGHLLQVRFNARPELTLFTLTRAPSGPAVG